MAAQWRQLQALRSFLKLSGARLWLVCVAVAVLTAFLATGRLPGVPDPPVPSVSLYASPQAAGSPLSVYLQPPAATLQAGGEGQLLALQFANHSANDAVLLRPLSVEPRNCFALHALGDEGGSLAAGQTRVALYRFTAVVQPSGRAVPPACEGQVAASFRYSFQTTPGGAPSPPSTGEGFISTSPIEITTRRALRLERFFRILGALTVPVLLGILSFWFQQFQTRKANQQKEQELQLADRQKEQALRLEVWKMIFPIVNGHMNGHYIQMVRKINDARAELSLAQDTPSGQAVVASLMLLRTAQAVLDARVGGFLFRTMPAESLCSDLADYLWQYCRAELGADWSHFDKLAAAVSRKDNIELAAGKLDTLAAKDALLQKSLTLLQTNLVLDHQREVLDRVLLVLKQTLEFENNRLWYPEWYSTAPVMSFSTLSLTGMDLPDARQKMLEDVVRQYRETVPPECRG